MPCHPNSYLLSRYLLFVTLNMRSKKYLSIRDCIFPVEEEQMTSPSGSLGGCVEGQEESSCQARI